MRSWLAKPPRTKELTKHEAEILKSLPDGWFNAYDVPYPRFKRPDYFLERLVVKGVLESSVIDGAWIFHKTSPQEDSGE